MYRSNTSPVGVCTPTMSILHIGRYFECYMVTCTKCVQSCSCHVQIFYSLLVYSFTITKKKMQKLSTSEDKQLLLPWSNSEKCIYFFKKNEWLVKHNSIEVTQLQVFFIKKNISFHILPTVTIDIIVNQVAWKYIILCTITPNGCEPV